MSGDMEVSDLPTFALSGRTPANEIRRFGPWAWRGALQWPIP